MLFRSGTGAGRHGRLHLSARPASATGAVTAQLEGVAAKAPLTPGAAAPPRLRRPVPALAWGLEDALGASGLSDRAGAEGGLAVA